MRLIYTDIALQDIRSIGEHIRQNNRLRAASFVREMLTSCRELQSMPDAFPLYPHKDNDTLRRRVFGRYLIFYAVTEESVTIVRVLHGARDAARILFSDD